MWHFIFLHFLLQAYFHFPFRLTYCPFFFFTILCPIATKMLLFPFQAGSLFSFSVSFFRWCLLLLLLLRFPSLTCHLAHQVMLLAAQLPSFLPSIRKVCRMPFVQGSLFSCLGCNFYFRCCLFTPASKDDEKWCLAWLTCRMSHPHT